VWSWPLGDSGGNQNNSAFPDLQVGLPLPKGARPPCHYSLSGAPRRGGKFRVYLATGDGPQSAIWT
jgi:hypothetical protein